MTKVQHSMKTCEWGTPDWLLDIAREVMGGIDLDPASSDRANLRVGATRYLTEADLPLNAVWSQDGTPVAYDGTPVRVWCNPPSKVGQRYPARFWEHLVRNYQAGNVHQALYLAYNIDSLQSLAKVGLPPETLVCIFSTRLSFVDLETGQVQASPPHGSALLYLPPPTGFTMREDVNSAQMSHRVRRSLTSRYRFIRLLSPRGTVLGHP